MFRSLLKNKVRLLAVIMNLLKFFLENVFLFQEQEKVSAKSDGQQMIHPSYYDVSLIITE